MITRKKEKKRRKTQNEDTGIITTVKSSLFEISPNKIVTKRIYNKRK
jgi:hypothetical protein